MPGRIYGRTTGWAYIPQLNQIIRVRVIPGGYIQEGRKFVQVIPYSSNESQHTGYLVPSNFTAATNKQKAQEKLLHLIK